MWKPVIGYEAYEVSDAGEVRSIDRTGYDGRKLSGTTLKPCLVGKGYFRVCLRKGNRTYGEYVHRLVATAFIPHSPEFTVINHIDGCKTNNCVSNLEWVTYSENNQDAYDAGLKERGSGFYNAKLTEDDVRNIKQNGKCATFQRIADKYGVAKATIRDILIGNTWKHIA